MSTTEEIWGQGEAVERPLEAVLDWRCAELQRLGFSASDVEILAHDPRVELAQARRLIALGCEPQLATRILAC